jgi:hypothetical protein
LTGDRINPNLAAKEQLILVADIEIEDPFSRKNWRFSGMKTLNGVRLNGSKSTSVSAKSVFPELRRDVSISALFVLAEVFTGVASAQKRRSAMSRLDAATVVNTVCVSPGGNESPGQNLAQNVTLSGGLFIPASSIKNGNLSFTVSTAEPPTPPPTGPNSAGCPNPGVCGHGCYVLERNDQHLPRPKQRRHIQ